jgi:outer membrane immunogenic protein
MRKYLLGAVSSMALIGSASAADLVPEFKSPVYQNWSGFYAGVDVGAAWGNNIWNDAFDASFSTSYPLNGVLGGAHAGWNYQAGPIVVGGEATFAFTNARGSNSVNNEIGENAGGSANLATTMRWLATLVGRAGVANGSNLYYLVAGFAVENESHNAELGGFGPAGFIQQNVRTNRGGYVLGMGAEFAVYHNWTARLEYNYMDFGKTSLSFPAVEGEPLTIDQQVHVVKLGISYLFH